MLSQTGSLAVSFDPASLRAVYLACYREICPTADRANLIGRAAALSQQGGLQHRIEGKYRLLKIPAVPARPPFTQHIAGAVQRQAAIFRIIVRAPLYPVSYTHLDVYKRQPLNRAPVNTARRRPSVSGYKSSPTADRPGLSRPVFLLEYQSPD